MIKIVIADHQRILCEGIKSILEADSELSVVGYALDSDGVLKLCEKHQPNVLLMDITLPGADVVEMTKRLRGKLADVKVIILTTSSEYEKVLIALKCGASGYILKDVDPDELVLAIKGVAKGLNVMHHDALSSFTDFVNDRIVPPQAAGLELMLTERELNIIKLVVEGRENREIAKSLFMSEGTVKNTITSILRKLSLKTRIQLVVFAVRNQLV